MKARRSQKRKVIIFTLFLLLFLTITLLTAIITFNNNNRLLSLPRAFARRVYNYFLVRYPRSTKLYASSLSQEIINNFVATNPEERLIVIDKTIRNLYLYENGEMKEGFPVHVALGFDPVNRKERRGDGRTPEGEYFIYDKHASANYKYFLEISYPNHLDVERGLSDGLITPAEERRILQGLETFDGGIRGTNLGDAIGIHTRGAHDNRPATRRNWTHGCIALERDDMYRVFQDARIGHKVLIIGRTYKQEYRSARNQSR
ncbi:MAG: L,D-transpeptidase [Candidatus Cloacimonetes bacterium]|nr:L,D-transpeptidase [Candidatus Cloacimonadota bacterium]